MCVGKLNNVQGEQMSKVKVTVVVELDAGIINEVHAYPIFEEAATKFKDLVVAEEGRYDDDVSPKDLEGMVDDGSYISETSGYELALVTADE